jgi:hypothetical protein
MIILNYFGRREEARKRRTYSSTKYIIVEPWILGAAYFLEKKKYLDSENDYMR